MPLPKVYPASAAALRLKPSDISVLDDPKTMLSPAMAQLRDERQKGRLIGTRFRGKLQGTVSDLVADHGHVIVDEYHHLSAVIACCRFADELPEGGLALG